VLHEPTAFAPLLASGHRRWMIGYTLCVQIRQPRELVFGRSAQPAASRPFGNATLAEAGHNIGLSSAGQAGLRQPRGQCGKKGLIHARII